MREDQCGLAVDYDCFCFYCQIELTTPERLRRHVRRMHPGTYAAQTIAGE